MSHDHSKNDYELAVLAPTAESVSEAWGIVKKYQAEIYHESQTNQIKLAYPIKKQGAAFFGYCQFLALPDEVVKIKNDLALMGSVLRFLITTPAAKSASRDRKPVAPGTAPKPGEPALTLTNEALEQKLEEILK